MPQSSRKSEKRTASKQGENIEPQVLKLMNQREFNHGHIRQCFWLFTEKDVMFDIIDDINLSKNTLTEPLN